MALIPLAARRIGESRGTGARLDAGGVVLVTAAALGLVWGLVRGNAATFGMYGSVFWGAFFLAQYLQTSLHYGPLAAGLRLAPWTVTLSLVAPVAGAWAGRIGERPLIAAGPVAAPAPAMPEGALPEGAAQR